MRTKESKFRIIRKLPLKKPVVFGKIDQDNFTPTISPIKPPPPDNTAYYPVPRNSSMKRLNTLIEGNRKTQEFLQESEEEVHLFYHQLSCISQNTSSVIGNELFTKLVQSLASVFGVRYAFIGKIEDASATTFKTVAYWNRCKIAENFTCSLKGTPCEKVMEQETCFYPQEVQKFFPDIHYLAEHGIESYLGVPLINSEKQVFGLLSLLDDKPITHFDHYHSILNIFAARCASEMERMDAEAQLQIKARELEKSNQALKDFVSIASHDLQEPLRKIVTFGSRLTSQDHGLKPESKEYLERMQKTSLRMQNLIADLLLFSRASTQTEPFKEIDLQVILKETIINLELSLQKSDGNVFVGPLPSINGNLTQVRQLFQNLLSNAIKFHEEGKPPEVEIHSDLNKQGGWEISIKDQGIGFDEKYKDRIFRPFERLHGRNEYEGTGMGLAICRKIMENHGGTLLVDSQPGQGACFTVTFPPNDSP